MTVRQDKRVKENVWNLTLYHVYSTLCFYNYMSNYLKLLHMWVYQLWDFYTFTHVYHMNFNIYSTVKSIVLITISGEGERKRE